MRFSAALDIILLEGVLPMIKYAWDTSTRRVLSWSKSVLVAARVLNVYVTFWLLPRMRDVRVSAI